RSARRLVFDSAQSPPSDIPELLSTRGTMAIHGTATCALAISPRRARTFPGQCPHRIRIGIAEPETVSLVVLSDHIQTRRYLMRACATPALFWDYPNSRCGHLAARKKKTKRTGSDASKHAFARRGNHDERKLRNAASASATSRPLASIKSSNCAGVRVSTCALRCGLTAFRS